MSGEPFRLGGFVYGAYNAISGRQERGSPHGRGWIPRELVGGD
jgi:hypothetical protein